MTTAAVDPTRIDTDFGADAAFRPLARRDGFLPIEDHGLLGDGTTAALVGRDGGISWLCLPRFDSEPLFCGLLDTERGGVFRITLDRVVEARQVYEPGTGVLVTELRGPDGLLRLRDALVLRAGTDLTEDMPAGRRELVRLAEVVSGRVRVTITLQPRGGAAIERLSGGWRVRVNRRPDLHLVLHASVPLAGLETTLDLQAGESVALTLRWGHQTNRHLPRTERDRLAATAGAWRRWTGGLAYDGPRPELIRRSAITLKMLDHFGTGGIVAAPTSSLPEAIGGQRNWDYRFVWIRDAAYTVWAFRRIGLEREAAGFLGWVLDAIESDGRLRVLYDLSGDRPSQERLDPELRGYRNSRPVRWGNGAADQVQHDVYGEVIDCAYLWSMHDRIDEALWDRLAAFADTAARVWPQPDQGIWEVRTSGRPFTYSAALCHVALDRAARLAKRHNLPGDVVGWRREADRIRGAIVEGAWNDERQSFGQHLDGGGDLDASLLALPLRRLLPADHPRMAATAAAIARRLGAGDGLIYRYLPDATPDGLPGQEGAFLLCSFWYVDNLTMQGRVDEARALFDRLCDRASPLGLLPEQIDPGTGAFLGNFPQALSHVGLVSSAVNLARAGAAD